MRKRFLGVYNPTIILTYIGVFCAVVGMGLLLKGEDIGLSDRMDTVMILLMASGVCDMFDGTIARRFPRTEQEKQFGIQLDSLADTVSFVAFPATMLLAVTHFHPASIVIACFYVFAGIMRLGWFNITTEESKGMYRGLPVTTSAILFPLSYLLLRLFVCDLLSIVYPVVFFLVGLLFILNFPLKKPGIKVLAVMAVLAIGAVVAFVLI